jgi:NAD(P)-dependent dehydrogenase (short-subunit alcohol dehydrogenase family)
VTGAGRRIGRAIALDLAAAGWRVAIHYNRSRSDAEAVADMIRGAGGSAVALPADLADAEAVSGLLPACVQRLGPPTCLVNNASEFRRDTLATLEPESWRAHLDVNLRTPVFLAQAFARHLPADTVGVIVNIIDQRVLSVSPEFFSYSLSKAALWTATRMLAQELAPRIRVNAIGPGPTLRSVHQTAGEFAAEGASTLLGRGVTPEEIAAAIRFILSSPSMTGQLIALDGGQHLNWIRQRSDSSVD